MEGVATDLKQRLNFYKPMKYFALITLFCLSVNTVEKKGCWQAKDEYCSSCNKTGETCMKCRESYLKDKVCMKSDPMIDSCMYYSANEKCKNCKFGYYMVSNKCEENDSGCAEQTTKGTCLACKDGLPVGGKCDMVVDKCMIINPNCKYCKGTKDVSECVMCMPGFTIYNKICKMSKDKLLNCMKSMDGTTCSNCNCMYYQDMDGMCKSSTMMMMTCSQWILFSSVVAALFAFFL